MKQQKSLFNNIKLIRKRLNGFYSKGKEWLTLTEVAQVMNMSRYWVHQKVTQGKIKAKQDKMKGKTKIYRVVHIDWLKNFIDKMSSKVPD